MRTEPGKIYFTISNLGNEYIFRAGEEKDSNTSNIIPDLKSFKRGNQRMSGDILKGIKEATPEQARWLEYCEEKGEFVPFKDVPEIPYSIY